MKFSRLQAFDRWRVGSGALFAGARQWRLSPSLEVVEGCLLGGQVTGTTPVVSERILCRWGRGDDRGVGSFLRRPFAWSKGRCGPASLAGRPVVSVGSERVLPRLSAGGSVGGWRRLESVSPAPR